MFGWLIEKLNPAQVEIARDAGDTVDSPGKSISILNAYESVEAVNRGVNMVVHACASLDYDVKNQIGPIKLRNKALAKLLNLEPNPHQSAYDFRLGIFTDIIFEGIAFIYFDGAFVYHLPAANTQIKTDPKVFIKGYTYNSTTTFEEKEVFSFKDVSVKSIYRGQSRLSAAQDSINTLASMTEFQKGFFDNGAVFGLVLTTESTLSVKAKERTILNFIQKYNPKKGGKRPVILDSGLKPHAVAETSFKDMDFDVAMRTHGEKVLQALGVPPILLAGGNNANISPNLRLFYLETVLPIIRAYTSSLERFFGYDIEPITSNISALQPELKDVASFQTSLVNAGIITVNESREKLRYPKIEGEENDKLRIPANIAGSAVNPSTGGRPASDSGKSDKEPKKESDKSDDKKE